jgi:hypothetical protein
MNNMGAMSGASETPKGRAMQAKHDRKVSLSSLLRPTAHNFS